MKANDIEKILQDTLSPSKITVEDDSGRHKRHKEAKSHGGGHFAVRIVSDAFKDKNLIERHQMVYQALEMPRAEIHALSITAKTTEEV